MTITPQQVNCFELCDIFSALCEHVEIQKVSCVKIEHRAGKKLGEKFSESSPPLMPFDGNMTDFINNQFIFNQHCVVQVEDTFYDPVFSTHFKHIDDIFDNSVNGNIVEYIDAENEEMAINLLKENPGMDLTETFEGWTLLHRAALHGLVQVVECLIGLGADINIMSNDIHPNIPLAFVPLNCQADVTSKLFLMLSKGIDPSTVTKIINESFVHSAMDMIAEHNLEGLQSHIANGLNIDSKDSSDGDTLLHQAVVNQQFEIVIWLIKNNANVDIENNLGKVPLEVFERSQYVDNEEIEAYELLKSRTQKQICNQMPDCTAGETDSSKRVKLSFFPPQNLDSANTDNSFNLKNQ